MPGELVHYEIGAHDVDRAQRFWSTLFGWEFGENVMPEGQYRMAKIGENAGAALYSADEVKGHPNVYLDTDDIDTSIAKAKELGGDAAEKMPVPGVGWFAECKDTEGNVFHLWQSDTSAG
jgi:predicted enzyme related to lactoylglutathione lyase